MLRAATARDAATAAVDEMSPILPVFLLIASLSTADATCDPAALYDPTYAADAAGKGGVEVSRWLHLRTSAFHEPVSYTAAWNALEASIDSHNASHVRVIYGGHAPKCRTGAYYGLECAWNREHLWPQSYGVGESSGLTAAAPPRTDLHALVPSLKALNSARSNRAFAQITDWPNDDARCGPKFPGCETPRARRRRAGLEGRRSGERTRVLDPSGDVSRVHRARVVLHGGAVRRGRAEHAEPDAGGDAREGRGRGRAGRRRTCSAR